MLFFSPQRREQREAAGLIYVACLAAARQPALFVAHGVPDTLQGRFEMVALMLFPVLNRLMHDPGDDPELARAVSEAFVADMDAVFREMGVSDPGVPKRMKTLYQSFAGRITAYREAMKEGGEALAVAIARNVFPDDPLDMRAAALARYLQIAVKAVAATDIVALRRGAIILPAVDPGLVERAG